MLLRGNKIREQICKSSRFVKRLNVIFSSIANYVTIWLCDVVDGSGDPGARKVGVREETQLLFCRFAVR